MATVRNVGHAALKGSIGNRRPTIAEKEEEESQPWRFISYRFSRYDVGT